MSDVVHQLGPGILLAAPILYAALGGLFTQRAGIFNIALEGFMLIAAYFSVATAVATGSLLWGTLAGVAAATVAAAIMAVTVVAFRADEVIVGIALNVLALGLTTFLLANAHDTGRHLELAAGYPALHLPWLKDIPVLGPIVDSRDLLVWLLLPAAVGVALIFRGTLFGLQLKAAGEAPLAARAAGVRVAGVRFASILISGAFCGVAGAELAIGSVHLFSENMTAGRGIIAFAAVIFGAGLVGRTAVACLLFGFAQALAGLLQIRTSFPSQFVLMVPYLLTIVAITTSDVLRRRRTHRPDPDVSPKAIQKSKTAHIVILGHLTIDDIHLPNGDMLPATTGGAAAYAALGAFLAQGDVLLVARVGDDYPVEQLRLRHQDGGRIHTEAVTVLAGRSIHNIASYAEDGSRGFAIENFGVLIDQTPVPSDLIGLDVAGRWALVTPAPLGQQGQLVETLKAAGALVALDTELHYLTEPDDLDRLRKLSRVVDCFLPSLEHMHHLFHTDVAADPAALKDFVNSFGCALTIVKCGRNGVVVFGPETPQGFAVPAVPDVEVADPTGAGDGFNGGCLVGLARGEAPTAAAVTGCVAASFVIQAVGVSVPHLFSSEERTARHSRYAEVEVPISERTQNARPQAR